MQWRVIWAALMVGGARRSRRAGPGTGGRCIVVVYVPTSVHGGACGSEMVYECTPDLTLLCVDPAAEGPSFRKDLVRVGEAMNPGPWHQTPTRPESTADLDIARPGKTGFWGTPYPGMQGARPAGDASDEERYALTMDTCNATSARSLYKFLRRTEADLVMSQEHHLPLKEVAAASTKLRRLGWQSLIVPAVLGSGGGAGVRE